MFLNVAWHALSCKGDETYFKAFLGLHMAWFTFWKLLGNIHDLKAL